MTRLELCRKLYRILRGGQLALGSGPAATTSQTGFELEVVSFIDDAYRTIQAEQSEWAFRTKQGTFSITSGTRTYSRATIQATITDYDQWLPLNGNRGAPHVLVYLTATGVSDSSPCEYVPYERWRGRFDLGTRPSAKPSWFTEQPDRDLEFDGTPDATYTVALDYRRTLHTLTADATEPLLPEHLQDAIVWEAAWQYCLTRDGSQQLREKVKPERRQWMLRLRTEQLPEPLIRTDLYWNS